MKNRTEKINAVGIALMGPDPDVIQLCASCIDHRNCTISGAITGLHIHNDWVTLRCVGCARYVMKPKAELSCKSCRDEGKDCKACHFHLKECSSLSEKTSENP